MGRTLDQKIEALPKARKAKIEARAADLIAEEATLQDLRKAFGMTQVKMAKEMKVGQDAVSRVEKRTDMLLSTLSGYIEGMGGKLNLVAEFPDRPPVKLSVLEPITDAKRPKTKPITGLARVRRKPAKKPVRAARA